MTATNSTNPKLVHDLARTGITTCFDTTLFVEAVRTLLKKNIESLIVLDDYSRAIGIFSRHEAVETYARSGINATNFDTLTVADVMRSDIPQVSANIPAITAAQIMLDQGLRNIYLMHHKNAGTPDRPVGLLSLDDIIGEMIGESE